MVDLFGGQPAGRAADNQSRRLEFKSSPGSDILGVRAPRN